MNQLICGDALEKLKIIPSNSIDEILTDPPYGYSFMNKDWNKAIISVDTWKDKKFEKLEKIKKHIEKKKINCIDEY